MIRPEEISYISQDGIRWAWRQILIHNIKPGVDRMLLLTMAQHADVAGEARPPQERLAELIGAHLRSVRRSIVAYAATTPPIIEIIRHDHGEGPGKFTGYRLLDWTTLSPPRMAEAEAAASPDSSDRLHRTQATPSPDSGDKIQPRSPDSDLFTGLQRQASPDSSDMLHRTRESTHFIKYCEDSSREDSKYPAALRAASAAPTPQPPVVVEESGPVGRRLPTVGDLVAAYDAIVDGTPLVSLNRTPTKAECIALVQAIKHPALGGNIEAWKRYVRWASNDTWLRGDREGGYPADLGQLCRVKTIDRWANTAKPVRPRQAEVWTALNDPEFVAGVMAEMTPIGKNGEHSDPNRTWNNKTRTWDYVYPPGFLEAIEAAEGFITSGPLPPPRREREPAHTASAGPPRRRSADRGD